VYLATGLNFPDALSAGAAAAKAGGPVLLVNGTATGFDSATSALLSRLKPGRLILVGGTNAISAGLAAQAEKYAATVTRLGGADRFETSLLVNKNAFTTAGHAYIASGQTFPDALAGSALAGRASSPLYVTPAGCLPAPTRTHLTQLGTTKATLLGGPNALSTRLNTLTTC
jgi:putative cell wall-binding protein